MLEGQLKLTLRGKIYGLVTLLTCGLACGTGFLFFELDRTAVRDAEFASRRLQLQDEIRVVQLDFKKQVQAWKDILLRGSDAASLEKYRNEFFNLEAEVDQRANALRPKIDDPAIQSRVDDFLAAHAALGKDYRSALSSFEASQGRDFAAADKQVKGKDRPPTDDVDAIVESLQAQTLRAQEANRRDLSGLLHTIAAAVVILVAGLLLLGILVARSITLSTAALLAHLDIQANGMRQGHADLTDLVPTASDDEFGEIAGSFNIFIEAVRGIMLRLSHHSERLASASEEITATSRLSSAAARSQADQTQQAATAIHEISVTGQNISQHSQEATAASQKASESARAGGRVVEETLATMRSISESTRNAVAQISELGRRSEEIGKIIGVIDDIADQTNLLALNAAIEAARAGEQGRGFAVVADEVRKLAERTTAATKEITVMIQSIQGETRNAVSAMELGSHAVELGVEKTSASGLTLQDLIRKGEEVGEMVSQIAAAATQQSSATGQINASVSQISSSIQQSATAAAETAKACSDLSDLAMELRTMVSNFKLESDPAPSSEPALRYRAATAH